MTRGLDPDGFIIREPALTNIQPQYLPVIDRLGSACQAAAAGSFHSLYLYGSVAMGKAMPGQSDLDALLLLTGPQVQSLTTAIEQVAFDLAADFPFLCGVGILLDVAANVLSSEQRYDMGFFVKCLCVGTAGEDLGGRLPNYRPSLALAAGTNGNIEKILAAARQRLTVADDETTIRAICRGTMRKIVRTGFTLVMPRAQCWTNDLTEASALFAHYYPARSREMAITLQLALTPTADRATIERTLTTFGPWLTQEYETRILTDSNPTTDS